MPETVIKLENISKQYRLGFVGTNTLKGDLQRWWYTVLLLNYDFKKNEIILKVRRLRESGFRKLNISKL